MSYTCAVLSLGTRIDAACWKNFNKSELGIELGENRYVTEPSPSVAQMKTVFKGSDEWLFLAGHTRPSPDGKFLRLCNDPYQDPTRWVDFHEDGVFLGKKGAPEPEFLKKDEGFLQHQNIKAVFWGGCNVCSDPRIINVLRKLFGEHLLIGWKSLTGWQILSVIMGCPATDGHNAKNDFYARVKGYHEDPVRVRKAWLEAADSASWGSPDPSFKQRFCVVDHSGRLWTI